MSDETDIEVVDRISADPRMPKIGDRIVDRYEVLKLLGEGGFAAVYLVKDTLAGGKLAVKVLDPEKTYKPQYIDRFRQEVLLVRELNHPNTIKIYDFGSTLNGCPFFAMEYIQGEPLDELIKRTGGLEPNRVIRIARQVLKSLSEAHTRQIIHRDLKPSNIMVSDIAGETDFVKVLDFGIAKALTSDLKQVKTQTGYLMCTPAYASPELLRGKNISPAADIFALGLILAEMLTGRKVMVADSVFEVVGVLLGQDPVPLPPELLSTPFGEVLLRATAKPVNRRYAHAKEMLEALEQIDWPEGRPLPVPETPVVGVSQELVQAADSQAAFHIVTPPSERVDRRVSKAHTLADPRFHERYRHTRLLVFAALGITFVSMVTLAIVLLTNGGDGEVVPETVAVVSTNQMLAPIEPEAVVVVPPVDLESSDEQPGDTETESPDAELEVPQETPIAAFSTPSTQDQPRHYLVNVIISSEPADAEVILDGEVIGRTPFAGEIESENDQVTVELRRRRYRSRSVAIDMTRASQTFHERLRREQREVAEPSVESEVSVESEESDEPSQSNAWDAVPRVNIHTTEDQ